MRWVKSPLRTVEVLEKLAATLPPMAYDVNNFATLGLLADLLTVSNSDAPSDADLDKVKIALQKAIADAHQAVSLKNRVGAGNRRSSSLVRELMRAAW